MDNQMMSSVFGPLSRKYCDWFFYLSVIAFVFMILTVVSGVLALVSKKLKMEYVMAICWSTLMYAAFYFQNRLLYTMCVK